MDYLSDTKNFYGVFCLCLHNRNLYRDYFSVIITGLIGGAALGYGASRMMGGFGHFGGFGMGRCGSWSSLSSFGSCGSFGSFGSFD